MRVPRTTGFPVRIFGSTMMRSVNAIEAASAGTLYMLTDHAPKLQVIASVDALFHHALALGPHADGTIAVENGGKRSARHSRRAQRADHGLRVTLDDSQVGADRDLRPAAPLLPVL